MGKAISREDTKNSCVVCKEEKKQGIWCNRCTSTLVCQDCILSMCEHGICDKCPVCRKLNWKKSNFKKDQIVPIKPRNTEIVNITSLNIRVQRIPIESRQYYCIKTQQCCGNVKNNVKNLFCVSRRETTNFWMCIFRHSNHAFDNCNFICCVIPFYIYLFGVLSILIFMLDIDWQKDYCFIWMPLIFGSVVSVLLAWVLFKCCGYEFSCCPRRER